LTAPLIRELVIAVLIEEGLEEYRHRLTRLGMPVHDVTQSLRKASEKGFSSIEVLQAAGRQVLTEYVLLKALPREVADSHLAGQIHLSEIWNWVLRPQTVHHDLRVFLSGEFKPSGVLASEAGKPENLSKALSLTLSLVEAFSKETSEGQTLEYFNVFLAPYLKGASSERVLSLLESFLQSLSFLGEDFQVSFGLELGVPDHLKDLPLAGMPGVYGDFEEEARRLLSLLVEAMRRLSLSKPPFNLHLIVKLRPETLNGKGLRELEKLHGLAASRGLPYFANISFEEASYTASGDCLSARWTGDWEIDLLRCGCLGKAAINLPRIAYEARGNKNRLFSLLEEAFRLAVKALNVKVEEVKKRLGENLLPNLSRQSKAESYFRFQNVLCTVCLVGLNEAVKAYLGYQLGEELIPQHLAVEILEFLGKLAEEEAEKSELRIAFSHVVEDEASLRLASLDVERYGWSRVMVQGGRETPYYSYVPLTADIGPLKDRLEVEAKLQPLFSGGHFTPIPIEGETGKSLQKQTLNLQEKVGLRFYAYEQPLTYCASCHETHQGLKAKCPRCGSLNVEVYARQSTRYLPVKWWVHHGKLKALKGSKRSA